MPKIFHSLELAVPLVLDLWREAHGHAVVELPASVVESLRWLDQQVTAADGHFRVVALPIADMEATLQIQR